MSPAPTHSHCGTCNMCCKVFIVPEVGKCNSSRWCRHATPGSGHGCKIYETRPERCSDFSCAWLIAKEEGVPVEDSLRPDRCRVVVAPTDNPRALGAHVDPSTPTAWRRDDVLQMLSRIVLRHGGRVIISWSDGPEKIMLVPGPGDKVYSKRIVMSEPDENGMRHYDDSLRGEIERMAAAGRTVPQK